VEAECADAALLQRSGMFFCVLFHPAESIHDMNFCYSQLLTGVAQGLVASCLEERE
jgi:hypothetical protein